MDEVKKFLTQDFIWKASGGQFWNKYKDHDEDESQELTQMKYLVGIYNLDPEQRKI